MSNRNVLVFRFSSLGDVAMTIPVLKTVIAQNKNTHITIVSRPNFEPLFRNIDGLSFIGADFKKDYNGFLGLIKLTRKLKKNNYTALADLHNVLRTKVLRFFFMNTKITTAVIDKRRAERKKLTRKKNKFLRPLTPIYKLHATVFKDLGLDIKIKPTLENHLFENPIKKSGIGVAPFAAFEGKIYPLKRMKKVVLQLAKENYKVSLFGGNKNEIEILNSWASMHKNIENKAGKYTLDEELKLIANLKVMLCMDSANMHLASLVGTRVVSIWGATHPFSGFLGFGQKMDDCIQRNDLACRPTSIYGNKNCDCCKDELMNISPKTVVDKIKDVTLSISL